MKACVVGSGGREHALADTLSATAEVIVVPGSAGIPGSFIDLSTDDLLNEASPARDADLFVIGPEVPLADGLADRLRAAGKAVFGPGQDGAQLESSKAWMKQLVQAAGIPTARYETFGADQLPQAQEFLQSLPPPYVIKTDGLAAGKGVLVSDSLPEAQSDLAQKLSGETFGAAGRTVVIEEGLSGPEVSLFAICDGQRAVTIPIAAQDHKRLGDGDTGPNTGGMGCYAPVPGLGADEVAALGVQMIDPALAELKRRGIDYRGVLYAGLMLTPDGPRLLEFNVRFGDPEAQVILPLIEGDLAGLLLQAANGNLQDPLTVSDDSIVCVVCAAEGYPAAVRTGDPIEGLTAAQALPDVTVYCAGVASSSAGEQSAGVASSSAGEQSAGVASSSAGLQTAGGRVLGVCGRGPTLTQARALAYTAVDQITWPGMQFRTDIATT